MACLLPAVPACGPQGHGPNFQLDEQTWSFRGSSGVHMTTDHFDIYTTVDDEQLRDYLPGFLETLYHERYAALLPAPPDSERRLQTYLFANQYQWMEFTRERFPGRHEVMTSVQVGGFSSGDICVTRYMHPRLYTLSVIAHEGLHQYFGTHFDQRIPAWLNEGLATYCEGFEVRGDRPVFHPLRNSFRFNPLRTALAEDTLLPIADFLATDAGQVIIQSESSLTRTYYAQAWATAVFLQHGGVRQYARGFKRMLADIAGGTFEDRVRATRITSANPAGMSFGEAVFQTYITADLETFERQFRDFATKLAGF